MSIVAFLTGLSLIAPAAAPQDPDRLVAKGEHAARLAATADACAAVGMSGAVLAARGGKVLVALGIGSADLDGRVPNTASTLFELASATKQFTGAAVCALVERGKLRLDDSIQKHLPGVPDDSAEITVRHLLQHTSGIPGSNSSGGGDDLAAVLPMFLAGGPKHAPGTHWEYWNQGYALLAAIIERRSGKGYAEFCRDALFEKAGLRTACFTGDEAPPGATVAVGRAQSGEPRSALAHPYGSYGYQYRGMGGAVANVWDLWRWDRALAGKKVLGDKVKRELFRVGLHDYALGWFVRKKDGRVVQSHGGSVRGFVCEVRRYPDDGGCLFVLCNRDDVAVWGVANLLEAVLFERPSTPPPAPLERGLQTALRGEFTDAQGAKLLVEPDGAVTRARLEWGGAPGKGPTTHGFLGLDGDGKVVLFDWADAIPLRIERDGDDGPVARLRLGDQRFSR